MTIDVNTILTDVQLDEYLGGQAIANGLGPSLKPSMWQTLEPARRHGLNLCLDALRRRTPRILEQYIADPTELRTAITYAASAQLYKLAAQRAGEGTDDIFWGLYKTETQLFTDEITSLPLTLTVPEDEIDDDGYYASGAIQSIPLERS